jgi:hypothetical protein
MMAKKQNAFLAKLQAQAAAKESTKTSAHVELDTIALLLAAHDELKVGPGRASGLVNSYLSYKMEIAEAIIKELDEDKSKKKEIIILRRDLAARMKEILGREGWEKYKTLFPFLREYWDWRESDGTA